MNGPRSHYLPSAQALEKISYVNRGSVLDYHLRQIEEEIDGLKSGWITVTDGKGKAHYLKLAHAKLKRLEKLAHEFGCWTDKAEEAATKAA